MRKNLLLRRSPLISFFIFLSSFCFAQVTEQWVARYNGPDNENDIAHSVAVDASGNVYVTGYSRTGTLGRVGDDYITIKYNKEGIELWVARYDGPGRGLDVANSIAVDAAGNVYVTGKSTGTTGTGTNTDYATIKYNSAGVEQWVARYSGSAKFDDNAESLALDALGNVYVTGWSGWRPTSSSNTDYATIKYNAAGVQQWVARYNGPGNVFDGAFSLAVDVVGNVYVTGESGGIRTGRDYATIKYNAAGIQQWVARYNGPASAQDRAHSLDLDVSGNVYVTGESTGIGREEDYATIKYNAAGVQQWVARYNGPGNGGDLAYSLAVDASENVYVSGESDAVIGRDFDYDYATIKYNEAGVEQWVTRYDGPINGNDRAKALALDASGNVYVTGWSQGATLPPQYDYATIKYDATGALQWLARYNGPGDLNDQAKSLTVDASGNVYVTGYSHGGFETEHDYTTIKYSQPPAIAARVMPSELSLDMPSRFRVSNYPNPVSAITKIEYEIPYDGRVAIKVYDVLGREVAKLVNADMKAGYYNTYFNASSSQNGVYYYRAILTGRKEVLTQSGKITVIK